VETEGGAGAFRGEVYAVSCCADEEIRVGIEIRTYEKVDEVWVVGAVLNENGLPDILRFFLNNIFGEMEIDECLNGLDKSCLKLSLPPEGTCCFLFCC
jgi:hypothetical protein